MKVPKLLIPVRKFTTLPGIFLWPEKAVLMAGLPADRRTLETLGSDLKRHRCVTGVTISPVHAGLGAVKILRDLTIRGSEQYRLMVTPTGVEIRAATDAGAYYGVQTLRELVSIHGRRMPGCRIEDWPDFARRGVYLDCSRGKVPTLQTLRDLVERLAHWKINEFQLYIENVFQFCKHPDIGRGFSPFSAADILNLQEHCHLHHIRLVGSLASLGHLEKILRLPRYACLGELPGYYGEPGGTTLCPTDPGSIRLMADLYTEFLPLFDAVDFNICGDEPWELGKGRSRSAARQVGKGQLYRDFILQLHHLCTRYGKRTNVWSDFFLEHLDSLGSIPEDMVILNWEYFKSGPRLLATEKLARAGRSFLVCPSTHSYGSHGCRLPVGMANIAEFSAVGLQHGAEGLLNTDWGDNGHRNTLAVSLHNMAYGGACSWFHAGMQDEGFTERFSHDTFGPEIDAKKLAGAIRILGQQAHPEHPKGMWYLPLYAIFSPPVQHPANQNADLTAFRQLGPVEDRFFTRRMQDLTNLRWPSPRGTASSFVTRCLAEYQLAGEMDHIACRRAMVAKQLMKKCHPERNILQKLLADTDHLASNFEKVWRMGNRPSRLFEHRAAFRQILGEYRTLLGKPGVKAPPSRFLKWLKTI